ncbi:MAG: fumarylacetoacetate hydrolase family protein, partial [Candidatus Puniceispirillaceae bacterium]
MRLLAFTKDHQPRIGALTDAGVIDLSLVDAAAPTDLGAVIKAGQLADIAAILAHTDGTVHYQLNELDLQVPIATPGKILCLGLNYMDHIAEGPFEKQPFPAIFMRSPTSLVAAHKPILAPRMSNTMDYEAELAVIIGQTCKHLTPDNALD